MGQNNHPFFIDNEVIVLTRLGVWMADGIEITHEGTRKLFSRSLVKEGSDWFLKVGRETKKIEIEDTPYFVLRTETRDRSILILLNDETEEVLDPTTLTYLDGRLCCKVKGKRYEARFLSAPYHDLLMNLREDEKSFYLSFDERRVDLRPKNVLFFDGECGLCDRTVQWVFKRDIAQIFFFSALQSDFSKGFFSTKGLTPPQVDTVILWSHERIYERSDAFIKILDLVSIPARAEPLNKFTLLRGLLLCIPKFLRDLAYRCIAKTRFFIFGKKQTCLWVDSQDRDRFLR